MSVDHLKSLPGAEIVLPGLLDLEAGRSSVNAMAVQCAATRLRKLGLNAPGATGEVPASHQLYERLCDEIGTRAYARHHAILARVASFASVAERLENRPLLG